MKKTVIIILVIIGIVAIGVGIGTIFIDKPLIEVEKDKEAKKGIVDGDLTIIEESLLAQHIYEEYRFKTIRISQVGPYYSFSATVDNIAQTAQTGTSLEVTFLSSTNKDLGNMIIEIPALAEGASTKVEGFVTDEKIFNSFDFKLSPIKSNAFK